MWAIAARRGAWSGLPTETRPAGGVENECGRGPGDWDVPLGPA